MEFTQISCRAEHANSAGRRVRADWPGVNRLPGGCAVGIAVQQACKRVIWTMEADLPHRDRCLHLEVSRANIAKYSAGYRRALTLRLIALVARPVGLV